MRFLLLSVVFAGTLFGADAPKDSAKDNPVLGVWHNKADPTIVLYFQAHKVAWLQNGVLQLGLVKYGADKVDLWIYGKKKMSWGVDFDQDELILNAGRKPSPWVKSKDVPRELQIPPVQIGDAKEVPAAKLRDLQTKLKDRAAQLSSAGKDPSLAAAHEKLVTETSTLLREIVAEYGWIDAKRFSKPTAEIAFDLLQKCAEVPLLVAVLPELQKEALAGNVPAMDFARFYDRAKLVIGEHQRYGTQIGKTEAGELLLLPLEDRSKVDEFRKELKLGPLNTEKDLKYEEGW